MAGPKDPGLTKQERVYRYIREHIQSGDYRPGYRVVLTQVARDLAVSALPVREAVRRLEAEGLIVFRPNEGAQVAAPQPHFFEDDMAVLAVLEGYGAALAAPHLTPARLEQLVAIDEEMAVAMKSLDALTFGQLEQDFHAVIYECCDNPSLTALLQDLAQRIYAIRRTAFVHAPYRGEAAIAEHADLLELIRTGQPAESIEAAARAHTLNALASFRDWHKRTH